MTRAAVTMKTRKIKEGLSVIDIEGEINAFAESPLMDAYTQATNDGAKTILLNFKDLGYMNSSGIGLLVTLLIRVKRQNQRLLACELSEHYEQIFELTRLNEAISIYPNEAEAVASVA